MELWHNSFVLQLLKDLHKEGKSASVPLLLDGDPEYCSGKFVQWNTKHKI